MLANQIGLSNSYVSENHYYASQEKFTAGEAAKKLKKLKIKVSAKEVVEAFKLIEGREPEWHHSGFYKGAHGSTMGRTFFFTEEQINGLAENWQKVAEKKAEIEAEVKRKCETIVKGFYFVWDHDYSGRYGKKVNFKVLKTYEGSELGLPKNFTELTPGEFLSAKLIEGKEYRGWDEPAKSEFKSISKIKYNRVIKARIEEKELKEKKRLEEIENQRIIFEEDQIRIASEKAAKNAEKEICKKIIEANKNYYESEVLPDLKNFISKYDNRKPGFFAFEAEKEITDKIFKVLPSFSLLRLHNVAAILYNYFSL